MAGRLEDKVCIVTGTGGSQGRAAALHFAREGALVVGCDLNGDREAETKTLVEAAGGSMSSLGARDLTDDKARRDLIDLTLDAYGRIDVLYNNAAGGRFQWVDAMSVEDWHATIAEELDIVFFLCQAAWLHLKKNGGSIVNTASVSGKRGYAVLPQIAHASAKAAVMGMTRQLAVEGAPFGIRANSLVPGLIATNATAELLKDETWRAAMVSRIMLGRPGKAEEVAAAAVFLASDEASFITGIELPIDGGTSAW